MGSSPPSRLTPLQQELLHHFFAHEQRFFLTGGGALAGFYFGHRTTEDLEFFSPPGLDLAEGAAALELAAKEVGATLEVGRTFPDFRRLVARRGGETCVVDLVIDRAPMVDPQKAQFDDVRVDTRARDRRQQDLHPAQPERDQGPRGSARWCSRGSICTRPSPTRAAKTRAPTPWSWPGCSTRW